MPNLLSRLVATPIWLSWAFPHFYNLQNITACTVTKCYCNAPNKWSFSIGSLQWATLRLEVHNLSPLWTTVESTLLQGAPHCPRYLNFAWSVNCSLLWVFGMCGHAAHVCNHAPPESPGFLTKLLGDWQLVLSVRDKIVWHLPEY